MIKHIPYSLELNEPFGTAHGTRTHTDGMLVAISDGRFTGFGEAFMPPYYKENQASMASFFERIDSVRLLESENLDSALDYISYLDTGNTAAKAAVDIALHDLFGQRSNTNIRELYKTADDTTPRIRTSYTIGIDTVETMLRKVKDAFEFEILKIKLSGGNDIEVIEAIRGISDQELFVDANQAWDDIAIAIETAERLVGLGVGLIEQPFKKGETAKSETLMKNCGVPVIADEEVQGFEDIGRLAGSFDGINIKLMKCGGIREAVRMTEEARRLGLSVLLGCMTESSIGISAAAGIAHLADWCDLDGNLLIKNDTCTAVHTIKGEMRLTNAPGIGITDDSKLRTLFGLGR